MQKERKGCIRWVTVADATLYNCGAPRRPGEAASRKGVSRSGVKSFVLFLFLMAAHDANVIQQLLASFPLPMAPSGAPPPPPPPLGEGRALLPGAGLPPPAYSAAAAAADPSIAFGAAPPAASAAAPTFGGAPSFGSHFHGLSFPPLPPGFLGAPLHGAPFFGPPPPGNAPFPGLSPAVGLPSAAGGFGAFPSPTGPVQGAG